MSKFYKVIDLQGCSLMDYTHDENWTKEQIREHLRDLFNDERMVGENKIRKNISLNYMLDLYELDIEEKQ